MDYSIPGDADNQDDKTKDLARARQSLDEENYAITVYEERVRNCTDDKLREALKHNRDEEKEHAAILIEWLRANDPIFDEKFSRHD